MQKLDFLSGAPKTFIFEKSSNKTNLGGVFTLIYLIIVIIIFLVYIFDYQVNPKYEAQFSSKHFYSNDIEYIENKIKDEKLNPKLSFRFELGKKELENEFFIYKAPTFENNQFEFRKEYKLSANDFNFVFGYKCKNTSCLPPQGAVADLNVYGLVLFYSGYEINHQNEISPLEPKKFQIFIIYVLLVINILYFIIIGKILYTKKKKDY